MTRRLFATVVLAAAVGITEIRALQSPAETSQRASVAPRVIAAERHDRSRALRDIAIGKAPAGERILEREPRWRRVSRHPAGLLPDPIVQNIAGAAAMPVPSQSVEGVGNVDAVLPADSSGDVGPNHFVQWVNLSFAVYSKGSPTTPPVLLYGPAPANTLWSGFGGPCESRNDGDPIVRYDHMADRWVMSQLAVPNSFFGLLFGPFYECIAVSATPDPLGGYYRYQFAFDKLNDYPKFGVWPDCYYMTINQFTAVSLQFAGQGVVAFERDKMLAGLPAAAVYYDLASVDPNLGGMLPADLDGPPPPAGSPAYFVQVDDDAWGATPDQLQLWKFHVDWAAPASSFFTRVAQLPTAPFDSDLCGYSRNCIPQPGTAAKVDAISDRLMYRLQYRNFGTHEALVVNHTVDVDGADHAGVRWYEIRNPGSVPVIFQQGTYAPDPDHRWMASVAMDKDGNIGLGFSVSGAITSPSIRYTGRLATDSLNMMTLGEADLMVGAGSQLDSSGRWGDYSTLVVDPADDCTFWYTQQYYAVTSEAGWQTRIGSFAFPGCQGSSSNLPVVRVTATAAVATEAGPTSGVFTVTRTGDTTQPQTLQYTVGGTASPVADYAALTGSVTIAAGDGSATIVVTPVDDLVTEPIETVIVSVVPDPSYLLGSSGATVTIVSDDVPPDLVVTLLTNPSICGAGDSLTVTDTTRNQATGPAGISATAFYLSINTTIDAADVSLGSRPVPALAGATSSSVSTVLAVPMEVPTGAYYVLAKADAAADITESLETNNTRIGSLVRVGPDLTVSAMTVPATAVPGGSLTVSDTTKNLGGGSAGASATNFYLSVNQILDAADVLLGSRQVGGLEPSATEPGSSVLPIPADMPGALYYVLAKADGGAAVAETQEGNNLRVSIAITIGANLVQSSVVVPAIGGAGSSVTVVDTVKNIGTGPAGASTTAFFLSTNTFLDSGDVPLGQRAVPALAANEAHSETTALQIPPGTATGSYSLLVKAYANNDVAEVSETNNLALGAIAIGPDLTISAMTVPATAVPGGSLTVSNTTKNLGGGTAPQSVTSFYLSLNPILDGADVLIGSRQVGSLVPAASEPASTVLTIPAGTPGALYYVFAKADGPAAVAETLENNNVKFSTAITVGADLVQSSVGVPALGAEGAPVTVLDTVQNIGPGPAGASVTKFYLSTNTLLDSSDVPLGERAVPVLAAAGTHSATTALQIPAGTAPGAYNLLVKADANDEVGEVRETNNVSSGPIRIGPDLTISALAVSGSTAAGATVTASDTVKNIGGGPASGSTTWFYLSTNGSIDASDVLLGSRAVAELAAGDIDTGQTALAIPAQTTAGNYFLIAKADGGTVVAETSESNNTRAAALRITIATLIGIDRPASNELPGMSRDIPVPEIRYSFRRLAIGFAASARRTGRYVAISAVPNKSTTAVATVGGSPGRTW